MQTPQFTYQQAATLRAKLAFIVLKVLGWKIHFDGLPAKRGVMIFYPHTSNWDFLYAIFTKWAISQPLRFLAKEKLFQGISGVLIGPFLRYCGGEPTERGVSTGAIPKIVERIQKADFFWLAIAPEGTRSYKPHWRSGFYHIALGAKVPLVCAFIDYPNKRVGVLQTAELTGDEATDLAQLRSIYQSARGRYPEKECPITFKSS